MAWLVRVRTLIYCALLFLSIYSGYVLLCAPCFPLLLMHRSTYRRTIDVLINLWKTFNAFMINKLLGIRVFVSGDTLRKDESALILLNHPTHMDWVFSWAGIFQAGWPHAMQNVKFVMKDPIKKMPGLGWVMQLSNSMFLKRDWKEDKDRIRRIAEHYGSMYKSHSRPDRANGNTEVQLVLFPEGTKLDPGSKAKSDAFADAHNRKRFNYVLHPRPTGFIFMVEEFKKNKCLEAIYDLTLTYVASGPDGTPPKKELEFMLGPRTIDDVHIHVRRTDVQDLPSDHESLDEWLQDTWSEKENMLAKFHSDRKNSGNGKSHSNSEDLNQAWQGEVTKLYPVQYVLAICWLYLIWWFVTSFLISFYGLTWTIIVSLIGVLASKSAIGGMHEIEMALERKGNIQGLLSVIKGKSKEA